MRYLSTRGQAPALAFEEAVLAGLASDGGLYVPESVPVFSAKDMEAMAGLSYPELAIRVMTPFIGDAVAAGDLRRIVEESYRDFRHSAIAPLEQMGSQDFLLELFHGPTLAFKDFALQFLGRLLDYFLARRGERITILGATSGDTGSAAIAGCRGRDNMDIFILYPHGRVSDVQRRQMTTVADANVHCLAVEGTFDDCQALVKALFSDTDLRTRHGLTAVNSINWARILAQVVYYFYAGLRLGAPHRAISFAVPTGNFGDIYAGYIAHKMGLPVGKLIIATNSNDILARTLETGSYSAKGVVPTLSPSMDIQVSSNFERLLFDLFDQDGAAVVRQMEKFRTEGAFALPARQHAALKQLFAAGSANDEKTKATIADVYRDTGMVLDPHTAVGVSVGRGAHADHSPLVVLATAHPAKFPDAVKAACGVSPALPPHMANLFSLPERFTVLANDASAIAGAINETA